MVRVRVRVDSFLPLTIPFLLSLPKKRPLFTSTPYLYPLPKKKRPLFTSYHTSYHISYPLTAFTPVFFFGQVLGETPFTPLGYE